MTATQLQLFTEPLELRDLARTAAQIQDQDAPDVIGGDLTGGVCEARAADYLFQARMIHQELERRPYLFSANDKLRRIADAAKWELLYAIYHYAAQIRRRTRHFDACQDLNDRLLNYTERYRAWEVDKLREKLKVGH